MSKPINYPSILNPAYKGFVSEARTVLNRVAARLRSSPGAGVEISRQISAFLAEFGLTQTLSAGQAIATQGQAIIAQNALGVTKIPAVTAVVSGGALTSVTIPNTSDAVQTGTQRTGVTVTGTGTTATFTVSATGMITGIALS